MKNSLKVLAAVFALFVGSLALAADPELAGVWQGKLQVDPKTALTIQFNFTKKPDGTYSAVLNSPDNDAMKNVSADSVSWSGGALKLDVKSLGGSYSGAAKGASIEGKWTQPGSTIPLVLSPYQKPQLSKAAIDTLVGTWSGKIRIPSGEITMVNRFKLDDKDQLQGTIAAVETGGQETPLSDIEFADNKLAYRIPRVNG